MRKKTVEIKCTSIHDLHHHFASIQQDLSIPETEETWDKLADAVSRLRHLSTNGAAQFPSQLISSVRSISRPLINSLNSERSRLSGASLELFSSLATVLESSFNPLLPLTLPPLLTLCTRTNKVFCARARSCIMDIIEHTRLPAIFTYLVDSLKDKSMSLRLTAAEAALACLNTFDPPELTKENRAQEIEIVIKQTIKDPNADVRSVSRKLFQAYNILMPSRVDAFVDPLTPTAKKYLNIKQKLVAKGPSSSDAVHKADKAQDGIVRQPTSSGQRQQSSAPLSDVKLIRPGSSNGINPHTRPSAKTEHHRLKSLESKMEFGNHLSSSSLNIAPLENTTESFKPVAAAQRVGPVRFPAVSAIGPVRFPKRQDALPSGTGGPVRLCPPVVGTRSALDGPRRVTILPPPSAGEETAKEPTTSASRKLNPSSLVRAPKSTASQHKPANSAQVPRNVPKFTGNERKPNPPVKHQSQKANLSSRTRAIAAASTASNPVPKRNPQSQPGKVVAAKEKVKLMTSTPSEDAMVAALIPLPPSPTILPVVEVGTATVTELKDELDTMPLETVDPSDDKHSLTGARSLVDQTPISALVSSIERGFRFPDYPPLPALVILEEDEEESFDVPQICHPEVKGLKIRSKTNEKDVDRQVLVEMPFNR